jgi:hypothetical protein
MDKINCINCGNDNNSNSKYCSSCGYELPRKTEDLDSTFLRPTVFKTDNRKKITGIIIGAIAFGLSYFAVQQIFFKTPSFDKVMMQAASEINKSCPIMVDQYTRLDNAVAMPGNTLQYNYTLVNITKDQVNIDTVKKYIEPRIINNVKTSPELKVYRDNKTTMVYNYSDKNGIFVLKFSVTPDMYK